MKRNFCKGAVINQQFANCAARPRVAGPGTLRPVHHLNTPVLKVEFKGYTLLDNGDEKPEYCFRLPRHTLKGDHSKGERWFEYRSGEDWVPGRNHSVRGKKKARIAKQERLLEQANCIVRSIHEFKHYVFSLETEVKNEWDSIFGNDRALEVVRNRIIALSRQIELTQHSYDRVDGRSIGILGDRLHQYEVALADERDNAHVLALDTRCRKDNIHNCNKVIDYDYLHIACLEYKLSSIKARMLDEYKQQIIA